MRCPLLLGVVLGVCACSSNGGGSAPPIASNGGAAAGNAGGAGTGNAAGGNNTGGAGTGNDAGGSNSAGAGAGGTAGSAGAGGGGSSGSAGATSAAGSSGSAGVGGGAGSGGAGGAVATTDAPASAITFTASGAVIMNPERGFYTTTDLTIGRNFAYVRQGQKTLLYVRVHLDAYLGTNHAQDLPQKVLDDTDAGFAAARTAGIKVIVRFYYDNGEGYDNGMGANDAPKDWMIRHIEQLAPIVKKNEDVLFVYQAGFIGA